MKKLFEKEVSSLKNVCKFLNGVVFNAEKLYKIFRTIKYRTFHARFNK